MSQIKSKKRVRDLGEVYTNEREVKAMMDLLGDTGYQISSRFLEPACGNGNFLVEILNRKLKTVRENYNCEIDRWRGVIDSVSSIYAIDICQDNVDETRKRILNIIKDFLIIDNENLTVIKNVKYILNKNIMLGDFINDEDNIRFYDFTDAGNGFVQIKVYNMENMRLDTPIPLKIEDKIKYFELGV